MELDRRGAELLFQVLTDNLRCIRHDEPMTVDWTHELLEQFDLQWNLAHGPSLETLTDEEYL
jgi:hypothetical protein